MRRPRTHACWVDAGLTQEVDPRLSILRLSEKVRGYSAVQMAVQVRGAVVVPSSIVAWGIHGAGAGAGAGAGQEHGRQPCLCR